MAIKNWSTTASSNTASPPNGAPIGTTKVSQFDDILRQIMADVRSYYNAPEFRDLGHTPTYISSTSFKIATDVTASYKANQRIKITDSSTLHGTISSSTYSAPDTTIVVTLDSGSVSASITAVAVGVDPSNSPIATSAVKGLGTIGALAAKDTIDSASLIGNGVVTKAKIENVANMKVLGNVSGSSAAPAEVSILDEDTMSSDSATAIPTQQSVKAYVDTAITGVASNSYMSGEVTVTAGNSGTITHSLGTFEVEVYMFLVCKSSELGHATGAIVGPFTQTTQIFGADRTWSATPTTTSQITYKFGADTMVLINHSTGASGAITPANWRAKFKVVAL